MLNQFRRSYEARVLVVPLGPTGEAMTSQLVVLGVEGIQSLTEPDPVSALTSPIGAGAWMPPSPASTSGVAESADIVVLVGSDLASVPEDTVREVCAAARQGGDLIAAVLVAPRHWQSNEGRTAMVILRTEVDILVNVRGPKLLAALLDALRGGARVEDCPKVVAELHVAGAERAAR